MQSMAVGRQADRQAGELVRTPFHSRVTHTVFSYHQNKEEYKLMEISHRQSAVLSPRSDEFSKSDHNSQNSPSNDDKLV